MDELGFSSRWPMHWQIVLSCRVTSVANYFVTCYMYRITKNFDMIIYMEHYLHRKKNREKHTLY